MSGILPLIGVFGTCGIGLAWQIRERKIDKVENRRLVAMFNPLVIIPSEVSIVEDYFITSENVKLAYNIYTSSLTKVIKGVVFIVHGYSDSARRSQHSNAIKIVQQGYSVVTVDLEGHGCSDGLHVYIPSFSRLVSGPHEVFQHLRRVRFPNEKSFLFGESLGGGVVCRMMLDFNQDEWDGIILIAPLIKIADEMMAPPKVVKALSRLADIIPTWPIVPSPNIIHKAIRRPEARDELIKSPLFYKPRWPRVKTSLEMLNSTIYLSQRMEEIHCPMLILHGEADVVTSCDLSQEFYNRSHSKDKTIKTYQGMWHSLLAGELPENQEIVWNDIFNWLNDHSSQVSSPIIKVLPKDEVTPQTNLVNIAV